MMELLFFVAVVIALACLVSNADGIASNTSECMQSTPNKVIILQCRSDSQLQIITYAAGRLHEWASSGCDVSRIGKFDCYYHDIEQTENARLRCNTYNRCPLPITYQTPSICRDGFHGPKYINIYYQCVPGIGSSTDVSTPAFLNPMAMGTHRLNGSRIALHSDEYPALIQTANEARCKVDIPSSGVKLLINIYDLSYLGDFATSPYCISWTGLNRDICAQKGGYVEEMSHFKSTEISFKLQSSAEVYVRFWMVLTAVSVDDDNTLRSVDVTCRDAETAADASALTGSVEGDYALGISLFIIGIILLIICVVYCCRKRRKRRKAEQNRPKYKYHPRGGGIEENDYLES